MTLVEVSEPPIDTDGSPLWTEELEAKVAPTVLAREVVAVAFSVAGRRVIGLAGWRIIPGESRLWRVRMLALPGPGGRIALSTWLSSTTQAALPHAARFSGVFDKPEEARAAVHAWAAEVDRASGSADEAEAVRTPEADSALGILKEEDVESFLEAVNAATARSEL